MARKEGTPKELGNQVDFNKIRKKRQRTQTVKRLIALGIVFAGIIGIFAVNRYMVDAGVTVRISDFVESMGGSGYPIPVPGGIIKDVKSSGSDLAVINDTNLYVYSKKGKTVNSVQKMTDNTVLKVNGNRMLTYDVGNKTYSLHSKSKTLLERTTDHNILGGDLNAQGDYAIITASELSASRVMVYNKKFEEVFELLSENLISDISINPKGTRMAAIGVNTRGGEVLTIVWLFDFGVDRELVKLELSGETPYNVQYWDDGRFTVLTDMAYRIYTSEGAQESVYQFAGKRLYAIEYNGRQTLLLLENPESGYQLVLLGSKGTVEAETAVGEKIRDFALGDNNIYTLTDTGITTYSKSLEVKDVFELRGISEIHATKDTLYYFGKEEIHVLGAAERRR